MIFSEAYTFNSLFILLKYDLVLNYNSSGASRYAINIELTNITNETYVSFQITNMLYAVISCILFTQLWYDEV